MKLEEIQAIAQALAPVIREMVGAQALAMRTEMAEQVEALRVEVTNAIGAIKIPELPEIPTFEVPEIDVPALAEGVKQLLTLPRDGKDGAPGKDADMEALQTQLRTLFEGAFMDFSSRVDKAVAAMPIPKDGQDGAPGTPGKDADTDAILAKLKDALANEIQLIQLHLDGALKKAVAALPVPEDGVDGAPGKDADMEAIQAQLRTMVDDVTGALNEKLEQAIAAIPAPAAGKDGEPGAPGKDCDMDAVRSEISGLFDQAYLDFAPKMRALDDAIAAIPQPKDGAPGKDGEPGKAGAPGRDGKDADPAAIRAAAEEIITPLFMRAESELAAHLETAIAAIPVPKDGAPGADGLSADMEELRELARTTATALFKEALTEFDGTVAKALAALPVPKDGAPGRDGQDGAPGKDGVAPTAEEVAGTFERRFSDLLLSFERRFQECVTKAIDAIPVPKDGVNGRDAFPLSAFQASLEEDGRTIVLSFEAGDVKENTHLRLPITLDRGVWREKGPEDGKGLYVKGDGVTAGGSFWIAQVDNPKGAPGISEEWRLAVKRGRDGKDLRSNASTFDPNKGVSM